MAIVSDPIDKQTLILRLSVGIFKMNDCDILRLLSILEQDSGTAMVQTSPITVNADQSEPLQRQMMIARLFVLIQQMDKNAILERLKTFNYTDLRLHRDFPRMECHLLVDFAVQGKAYRGYMRDISAGGVFIVTSEQFRIGQEIRVCFTLDQLKANLPIKIDGTVKRNSHDGIGVQYQTISNEQQTIINSLVQEKL